MLGTILLIILILAVFGSFGGGIYGGWAPGNGLGLVLLVLLLLFIFGRGRLGF